MTGHRDELGVGVQHLPPLVWLNSVRVDARFVRSQPMAATHPAAPG
jgi:hypothetical protein